MSQHNHVFKGRFIEQQRGLRHQGVEPPSCLVHRLGDKLRRELRLKQFLVFKRIVILCKRHRTGIKPAVDHLRHTLHHPAALRTGAGDLIDVGPVQLHILRFLISGKLIKFFPGTDRLLVSAARALPDIERRAPVTVSGNAPVLNILQPVSKPPLPDGRRNPVYGPIVFYKVIPHRRHLNKPGLSCIIDQRRITAPAERIIMFKFRRGEKLSFLLQIYQNILVRILDKLSGIGRFPCHKPLAVHKLYKGQFIFTPHICIVLTKCRRNMHNTGTVRHCDIVVTCDIETFFMLLLGRLARTGK